MAAMSVSAPACEVLSFLDRALDRARIVLPIGSPRSVPRIGSPRSVHHISSLQSPQQDGDLPARTRTLCRCGTELEMGTRNARALFGRGSLRDSAESE